MATFVAGNGEALNKRVNQRVQSAKDLGDVRKIAIENINQQNAIQAQLWVQYQQLLYPNLTPIVPQPDSTQKAITEESQAGIRDESIQASRAHTNLLKICDERTAQYMMDRMTIEDYMYLNQHFNAIAGSIKGEKLDKDVFLNFIKTRMQHNDRARVEAPNQVGQMRNERANRIAEQKERDRLEQQEIDEANRARRRQEIDDHDRIVAIQNETARQADIQHRRQQERRVHYNEMGDRIANRHREEQRLLRRDEYREQERLAQVESDRVMAEIEANRRANFEDVRRNLGQELNKRQEQAARSETDPKYAQLNRLTVAQLLSRFGIDKINLIPKTRNATYPSKKKIIDYALAHNWRFDEEEGHGLQNVVFGRGGVENIVIEKHEIAEESQQQQHQTLTKNRYYLNGGKYFIDMKRLATDNMLVVKYSSSNTTLTMLPIQRISNAVRTVLEDILNRQYNAAKFNALANNEKRLIKRIIKATKMEIDLGGDKDDDEFQKKYDILLGEYNSGNNSPVIKQELKRYVVEAMNEGLLPKTQALYLIYQLSCP